MAKRKRIFVCPLDWGLGHATRMVPVIDSLIRKGADVIIGADNRPYDFFKQRFPDSDIIRLPGFVPVYPENGSMAFAMIRDFPKMKSAAKKANQQLQGLIDEQQIDVVISDNRYELYSKNVFTVFVTHQLNIQTPGVSSLAKPVIQKTINNYIQHFNELWIPDFEGVPNLSGKLSHTKEKPIDNYHFVGPLSRFSSVKPDHEVESPDILAILSGPEPQRTLLEEIIIGQAEQTDLKTIVLQGKPEESKIETLNNITLIPHLGDEQIAGLIKKAKFIICRPGYSTIMDLAVLGKQAIFIPTPGQTEQEFLAKKYQSENLFYCENQNDFNLKRAIVAQQNYSGLELQFNDQILEERIDKLLD